jgi:hypothetical protein
MLSLYAYHQPCYLEAQGVCLKERQEARKGNQFGKVHSAEEIEGMRVACRVRLSFFTCVIVTEI